MKWFPWILSATLLPAACARDVSLGQYTGNAPEQPATGGTAAATDAAASPDGPPAIDERGFEPGSGGNAGDEPPVIVGGDDEPDRGPQQDSLTSPMNPPSGSDPEFSDLAQDGSDDEPAAIDGPLLGSPLAGAAGASGRAPAP